MKKIFTILLLLLVLVGCAHGPKDNDGNGETAYGRCKEAFAGLKADDRDAMIMISFGGMDENKKFFLDTEQGAKIRSYMTYKITGSKELKDETYPTYEFTVTVRSIDMLKVIEEYEKLGQKPLEKEVLLEAIDNSKDERIKTTVKVKTVLYPDVGIWRIRMNDDVFNAIFPNYDKYIEWRN
ncbi:MAG: hypothetical protein Q4C64_04005 [Erysipelotrichia bacterium]|nr:hypothetical protein [Erysipelotrichia bacterium]